jgi:hypothetical protein
MVYGYSYSTYRGDNIWGENKMKKYILGAVLIMIAE